MSDLVYNRTVSISRAQKVSDSTKGARMEMQSIYTGLSASIQPKRDRNISAVTFPSGVASPSMDAMITWKIILKRNPGSVLKGDVIIDENNVKYIVEVVYPSSLGFYIEARVDRP